jgi:hypothetical protein
MYFFVFLYSNWRSNFVNGVDLDAFFNELCSRPFGFANHWSRIRFLDNMQRRAVIQ